MQRLQTLAMAALIGTAAAAFAHGNDDHAKKPGPIKKEQKAWGIAGNAKAAKRSVEFRMSDTMRFTPDRLDVKRGETLKLVIRNEGQMLHEFVLGTKAELDEHAALDRKSVV